LNLNPEQWLPRRLLSRPTPQVNVRSSGSESQLTGDWDVSEGSILTVDGGIQHAVLVP
jgi:hypothetical protein